MSTLSFKIDLTETFDHLPNAPIVEAVIHWQARHGKQIEPSRLLELLKEKLPNYPDSQRQQEIDLEAKVGPGGSAIHQRHVWHGFRFESHDQPYVAQFTRNGFVFSRLKPYEGWEQFKQEGERLWQIYCELTEPTEVSRLGVRFINQIPNVTTESLGGLLTRPPESPAGLELPIAGFMHQEILDIPNHPYRLNVIQTVQPANPPKSASESLIVDIDAYTSTAVRLDEVDQKLLQMRWIKNKAFFSLLTPSAIDRFRN